MYMFKYLGDVEQRLSTGFRICRAYRVAFLRVACDRGHHSVPDPILTLIVSFRNVRKHALAQCLFQHAKREVELIVQFLVLRNLIKCWLNLAKANK
jgi:hypothetical protein